jgi:hypothetical protein
MHGLAVHAVALVVVHRRQRRVDRNLVEVGAAERLICVSRYE